MRFFRFSTRFWNVRYSGNLILPGRFMAWLKHMGFFFFFRFPSRCAGVHVMWEFVGHDIKRLTNKGIGKVFICKANKKYFNQIE